MTEALGWFEGELGLSSDPAARWRVRSDLWDELAKCGVADVDAFDARLRALVHQFHEAALVANAIEPKAVAADYLRRVADDLEMAARHCTRRLPFRAQAAVELLAERKGIDWRAMRERVQHDAEVMHALLVAVERDMQDTPAPPGRKPKTARDATLKAIADELGRHGVKKRGVAARLALRVLQIEGIAGPAPEQSAPERAVRRARRGGQK